MLSEAWFYTKYIFWRCVIGIQFFVVIKAISTYQFTLFEHLSTFLVAYWLGDAFLTKWQKEDKEKEDERIYNAH